MKELLKNVRKKYDELNKKLNELSLEEERLEEEHDNLLDEYNLCNKAYSDSCDIYTKTNNRIENKKRKYIDKKNSRQVNLVMLITLFICLTITGINVELGLIANKFFACMGCLIVAGTAGIIDLNLFWDKLRKKYEKDFYELESTKNAQETLDKFYVQKLRNEKELNDSRTKVMDHAKITTEVTKEKNRVEKEINDIKVFISTLNNFRKENETLEQNNEYTKEHIIDELSQVQSGQVLTKKMTRPKHR